MRPFKLQQQFAYFYFHQEFALASQTESLMANFAQLAEETILKNMTEDVSSRTVGEAIHKS